MEHTSLLLVAVTVITVFHGQLIGCNAAVESNSANAPDANSLRILWDKMLEIKANLQLIGSLIAKNSADVPPSAAQKASQQKRIHPGDVTKVRTLVVMATVGSRSYRVYREPKLNFNDAYTWCRERGMQLVSIENAEAQKALEQVLPENDGMYWTSGNDLEHLFSFFWKSSGKPFTYTKFFPPFTTTPAPTTTTATTDMFSMFNYIYFSTTTRSYEWYTRSRKRYHRSASDGGEPNYYEGKEQCVSVSRKDNKENELYWYDIMCAAEMMFVCEKV